METDHYGPVKAAQRPGRPSEVARRNGDRPLRAGEGTSELRQPLANYGAAMETDRYGPVKGLASSKDSHPPLARH